MKASPNGTTKPRTPLFATQRQIVELSRDFLPPSQSLPRPAPSIRRRLHKNSTAEAPEKLQEAGVT